MEKKMDTFGNLLMDACNSHGLAHVIALYSDNYEGIDVG